MRQPTQPTQAKHFFRPSLSQERERWSKNVFPMGSPGRSERAVAVTTPPEEKLLQENQVFSNSDGPTTDTRGGTRIGERATGRVSPAGQITDRNAPRKCAPQLQKIAILVPIQQMLDKHGGLAWRRRFKTSLISSGKMPATTETSEIVLSD